MATVASASQLQTPSKHSPWHGIVPNLVALVDTAHSAICWIRMKHDVLVLVYWLVWTTIMLPSGGGVPFYVHVMGEGVRWAVEPLITLLLPTTVYAVNLDISRGFSHKVSSSLPQRPLLFPAVKTVTYGFPIVNLVSYTTDIRQHHQVHNNWLKIEWGKNVSFCL